MTRLVNKERRLPVPKMDQKRGMILYSIGNTIFFKIIFQGNGEREPLLGEAAARRKTGKEAEGKEEDDPARG